MGRPIQDGCLQQEVLAMSPNLLTSERCYRFATYMYVFALLEVNATILSGAQNHRGLRIKDGGRKPIILMLWNQYNVVSPKRPTLKNLSYRERLKCLNIYLRTSTTPYRFCFGYKIVCACRPHIGVDLSARLGGHNRG